MEQLDKVFAQQESTNGEPRAGADEAFDVRSVCIVHWHCDWRIHGFLPVSLEVSSPFRKLAEAASVN